MVEIDDIVRSLCGVAARMHTRNPHGGRIIATWLWNLIDEFPDPEPLWEFMAETIPWAFSDPAYTNSIRITYPYQPPVIDRLN